MQAFDSELLKGIDSLATSVARQHCIDIIEKTNTKPVKKAALIRDINAAPNSKELSRIMWNVLLAGEGFSMFDSLWQKTYGK